MLGSVILLTFVLRRVLTLTTHNRLETTSLITSGLCRIGDGLVG